MTTGRVFRDLVDRRAFLDTVILSVGGTKIDSPLGARVRTNRPIGGDNRNYARSERGVLFGDGNPYEIRYGAMRLTTILPPLMLTLRSERTPLSAATVIQALDRLCQPG